MQRLYVSCETGNDAWTGTLAAPDKTHSDGPLRTLAAAQTAVRRIRRGLSTPDVIEVVLAGGRYRLTQTWRLGAADSGFGRAANSHARTWPVVWRAAEGEDVTISGGHPLHGWQPDTLNGHAVWRVDIPWADSEANWVRQLWIGGARRPRARLPKNGTYRVADAPDAVYTGGHGQTVRRGSDHFVFKPGDLSADWTNLQAVDIQFRGLWMSPRARLLQVEAGSATARLDRNTTLRLAYAPGDGLDYVVENAREALTEPGEWCLDPAAGCIWYRPLPGEHPETAEAVAGGLACLLELNDARWLRFEQLTFAHAEWQPPPTEAVAEQSSVTAPGAVSVGSGCEGIVFDHCHIAHVGGYGLECRDGATDVTFQHGAIRDLGAGGVKIWHGCRRCVLTGSEIADGGHLWMSGAGVLIGKAGGNAVTHCHIHDFYYTAISVGWTWGYAEGDAYGNVIEWNHIHAIGKGLLSDMGGVYLLGNAMGTRVRHNRIHDIRSLRYGGWAIYPDEGSSDLLIEHNLCYQTDREIFHQHYGRNNLVRNNIFAYGGEAVLAYSRMEEHLGLVFERNIFLARGTPIVKGMSHDRWRAGKTRFENNLYWSQDGPVSFDAGARALATQPFSAAYADEAERFHPLPADGTVIRSFSAPGTMEGAIRDIGEFHFTRDATTLTLTGRFEGAGTPPETEAPLWQRARIEIFLKPFPECPTMVQFGVAFDGAHAVAWFGCSAPANMPWEAKAHPDGNIWTATLTVPLDQIEARIRKHSGIQPGRAADWRGLAGVTLPPATDDFATWQEHSGDAAGIVADPLFTNPEDGDFSLSPDSPAFALGFVPFACPGLEPT